jgi:hypothetical protein
MTNNSGTGRHGSSARSSTTGQSTPDSDSSATQRIPTGAHTAQHAAEQQTGYDTLDRSEVLTRQKQRFGGIKWGSAFFGWLTATGVTVVLTALASAAGTAFGLTTTGPEQAGDQLEQAAQDPSTVQTAGLITAIVVLVVLLVAYYCGGYVAGRMARFNGLKQGLAVWLWAVFIAIIAALVVAVAGSKFNILAKLNGLPRLPVDEGTMTTFGIITALVAVAAALIGALLGGTAGMRFHRRVDRTDVEQEPVA